MGGSTFDPKVYRNFTASTASKPTTGAHGIYTSSSVRDIGKLNPLNVKIRESRDSTVNPHSTPIICAIDVTGSMGMLADTIARKGLGTVFEGLYTRKPVSDPHVMFMAIGDANFDQAPLQISQFEADASAIIEQLTQIWVEHGGGGNSFESYNLAWYFAARHTVHDSLIKRGKRGYLFTIGDEPAPHALTKAQIKKFIGDDVERDVEPREILEEAQRMYDVFHIVVTEGNHCRSAHGLAQVKQTWGDLLGQHVIFLDDHTKLAETIVSTIEVIEGRDAAASAAGWGAGVSAVVLDAVKDLPKNAPKQLSQL